MNVSVNYKDCMTKKEKYDIKTRNDFSINQRMHEIILCYQELKK